MLFQRIFFCFYLLHLVNSHLQINLHLTNWTSEDDNLQHDCLQVPAYIEEESDHRQIISYCMGEWPSKFHIRNNNLDQKLTFEQLSKQNITSQQLYLWSAPIDLIEEYQFYLNQLSKSEKTSLSTRIFYNCTLPYFGSQCQYLLQDYKSYHSSLDEIVHDYYRYNLYEPTLLTCYMHLECNRGPFPSCLDWREICDGKVDCLDDERDEENCWQMEIQIYSEYDYLYSNRKCISEAFFRDDSNMEYCIGESNSVVIVFLDMSRKDLSIAEPTFRNEDISCTKFNSIENLAYTSITTCLGYRTDILFQATFSIKPNWLSNECWAASMCKTHLIYKINLKICDQTLVNKIINEICPHIIYIPAVPVLLGHIYVAYDKNALINYIAPVPPEPTYFCYNEQLLYVPDDRNKKLLLDNNTCRFYEAIRHQLLIGESRWFRRHILPLFMWLRRNSISIDNNSEFFNKSKMYKCINSSKYIPKNRLFDGVNDCPYKDDERKLNKTCPTEPNVDNFKCLTSNKCIQIYSVQNGYCKCNKDDGNVCDNENLDPFDYRTAISFQTICDGFTHLLPQIIEGQIETDETNCEQWPLFHIYNRCDGFWHHPDGSDEINCDPSPLLNCSTNHHICVSIKTNELICLPIEKANDGIIDCIGAADQPTLCRDYSYVVYYPEIFYCYHKRFIHCISAQYICDKQNQCTQSEDEQACKINDLSGVSLNKGICTGDYESDGSDVAKILCRRFSQTFPKARVYFTLDQWQNLIRRHQKQENTLPYQSVKQNVKSYQPRCHRGLDLQVWLDKQKKIKTNVCLCPPSYYGDICQYQNQRVSLTLQFRVSSDSVETPFIIIVSLIDHTDERIIHSYEQFTYLSIKTCQRKFDIYLLYSTRPKDETKSYSIHIDIYEKTTKLDYRTSFIKSLNFTFLPVHRVALQINIPRILDNDCSDIQCQNGKCRKYFNDQYNRIFCQCERGWSGRYCTIPYTSTCSSDSLSLGQLANNRSLCVCPVNKIGPRCLINDETCRNTTCLNKGKCIPIDEYKTYNKTFTCICLKEFIGDRCEIARTKLMMTFDKSITVPSSILIHFIEAKLDASPVRTTTFKTTSTGQDSIIVYWSLPFHVAFVELENKTYYLTYMQPIYNQSQVIERTLTSSDRCLRIGELFNETFANASLLRRIKSYHLPCQANRSQLKCFYDEIHLCLCQQIHQQYVANCFEFDHNMSYFCAAQNVCEHGGQCFQEQTPCSRVFACRCPICYYGVQCQLSTSGFSLSLDAILGYHIRPNLNISQQPSAVLISLVLMVIITLLGFANGILSLITFKTKTTHESGCGLYLFSSSIITLLTMVIFFLKFLILLLSQMGTITNRSFLTIQCRSIDFFLRFCLTMDQWLTAFVAIERAFVVTKQINFNKKKFKSLAKWAIGGLVLISMVTNIHDPIYRKLFIADDNVDDEKKLWCIVEYPSAIRIINLIINIIHFIVPFIINVISALTIIILSTRQQAAIKKKKKYREILKEQIHERKNLLIGSSVLAILAVPRLIISFVSGCMKSINDSWLFLLGYFISLIPPLLTFILFVLPSKTYKDAFRKAISRHKNLINRRLLR